MTPLKGPRVLFAKKTNAETSTLNDVKNALLASLGNEDPGTDTFETLLAELERVEAMITKNPSWSFKPSPDVILNGVFTLISIAAITKHEQLNVITSKAVSFLPKLIR